MKCLLTMVSVLAVTVAVADVVSARVDPSDVIGEVSPMIYGGFIEHMGRNVYGGVYDPDDPTADGDGFRKDVIEAMKDLSTTCFRYPGGCYTDLWKWEDGVGPRERRPVRLDPAWRQKETNEFGLDEFLRWIGKVGDAKPIICLNLSTRGVEAAQQLWEYCNFPKGTTLSDARAQNGHPAPYGVEYWCLGNEIYGGWEIGHRDAGAYARDARETAKMLKAFDNRAKLILCGCAWNQEWNRTVLSSAWSYVDFLSIHESFDVPRHKPPLRAADRLVRSVKAAAKTVAEVAAAKKSDRKIGLSVDEYIFWDGNRRFRSDEKWMKGRHALEQDFTLADGVVMGDVMTVFHNHADTVKIACVAQSVNVIAPVRTESGGRLWHQATYDPMAYAASYGRGKALRLKWTGNEADDIHASAVLSDDGLRLAVFTVNRREEGVASFALSVPGAWRVAVAKELSGEDLSAVNSAEAEPVRAKDAAAWFADGALQLELKPASWRFVLLHSAN